MVETGLIEPGDGPASVGIEVAFLLCESLFQGLVD